MDLALALVIGLAVIGLLVVYVRMNTWTMGLVARLIDGAVALLRRIRRT